MNKFSIRIDYKEDRQHWVTFIQYSGSKNRERVCLISSLSLEEAMKNFSSDLEKYKKKLIAKGINI